MYEEKNKLIKVRFMSYLVITSVLSGMTAARMTDTDSNIIQLENLQEAQNMLGSFLSFLIGQRGSARSNWRHPLLGKNPGNQMSI